MTYVLNTGVFSIASDARECLHNATHGVREHCATLSLFGFLPGPGAAVSNRPVLRAEAGVACDLSWRISRLTGPTGQPQQRDQRRPPDWQSRPIADHRVTVMMPSRSSPVEGRGILQHAPISPHKLFSIMTAGKVSGSRQVSQKLWGIPCVAFVENMSGTGQATERHKRSKKKTLFLPKS